MSAASITASPRGFSVPSTKPRRSRSSKYRKPWTSSTAETDSPRRAIICAAISKQRSIRFARIWNSRSPGVETAWCWAPRISRNGWSPAGRGSPNSRSHASDPIPITQERPASSSRNSTARINAGRSAQNDRTAARLSRPGFIVTTRKIAARVSGADTGCARAIALIYARSSELAFGGRSPMTPRDLQDGVNRHCLCHPRSAFLQPKIAQARVIIGTAAKRPVIFAPALPDREVVYAGDAQAHEAMRIELPVLVAIAAKPVAAIIVPFVGEANRNSVLAERPDLLDQAVVKLAVPFAREEGFDGGATLDKLRAIAPATVYCVGKRNASGVAGVPCVFGHSHLLCGGLGREGRERRGAAL